MCVVYSSNGMLYDSVNEWNKATYSNMNKSQIYNVEGKKPRKNRILLLWMLKI